jgi:hypothetical protein
MNQLKLSCPFCRDTSTFKNIDELPKNFSILDALEGLSSVKAIIDCQTADNADLKGPSHNGGSRKRAKLTSSATAVTMNANYAGTTVLTAKLMATVVVAGQTSGPLVSGKMGSCLEWRAFFSMMEASTLEIG